MTPMEIAIVGTGNVAFHLVRHLAAFSQLTITLFSRSSNTGQELMKQLDLEHQVQLQTTYTQLAETRYNLVFLCLPDTQIPVFLQTQQFHPESTVVHTSGSQPLDVLNSHPLHGVLYPFQTFSKDKEVHFESIPLFIEASSNQAESAIRLVSALLGGPVRVLTSSDRLKLHLAAVISGNFSNYLYSLSDSLLKDIGMDLHDIRHLLYETVDKALAIGPKAAQTGPAIRGDEAILKKHIDLLYGHPDWQKVYELLSDELTKRRSE